MVRAEYSLGAKRIPEAWRKEQRNVPIPELVDSILRGLKADLPCLGWQVVTGGFEEAVLNTPPPLVEGAKTVLKSLHESYGLEPISDIGVTPRRMIRKVL